MVKSKKICAYALIATANNFVLRKQILFHLCFTSVQYDYEQVKYVENCLFRHRRTVILLNSLRKRMRFQMHKNVKH